MPQPPIAAPSADSLIHRKSSMVNAHINIAVIGLGYVGLPLAVEFGKQRPVLGFDINQARIAELQSGQDHTLEVCPEELKEATHLAFSADAAALGACNFFIVTVPLSLIHI